MTECRRFSTGWMCVAGCNDPAHDEFLPASPPAVAASTGTSEDVEALLADAFGEWLHRMHGVVSSCDHTTEARGLIAALQPWLAAREAAARAEERERIAQAIEADCERAGHSICECAHRARLVREVRP